MIASVDAVPKDGSEVRVRIGARWFTGAWVENVETGEHYFGVRLNGTDWTRVGTGVIAEVTTLKTARKTRQATAPALPVARPRDDDEDDALLAEVADRVTAMVRTIRTMHDIEGRFLSAGKRVSWPAHIYTAEDIAAQRENHENRDSAARPPRRRPSPRDLAQLDETWGWFAQLDPLDVRQRKYLLKAGREPLSATQRLVWRIALGVSPHQIAKETGEHHETIRRRHARTIARIAAIAAAERACRLAAAGHRGAA